MRFAALLAVVCQAACQAGRAPISPAETPTSSVTVDAGSMRGQPAGPVDAGPEALGTIDNPAALEPLFVALRRAEDKDPAGRVAIVQLGDSHTSGDFQTGRMRRRLQDRFGDAGRGYLLPGRPLKNYYQLDAVYGSDGDWELQNGLRKTAEGPFGLGGLRVRMTEKDSVAWVGTCADCAGGKKVARFDILYRPLPDGGHLEYRIDEESWQRLDTKKGCADSVTGYQTILVSEGEHRLTMRPRGNGPVDLFGVVLERLRPGVVVDSVGVAGARAWHLWHWDWTYLGEQLTRRHPALVILAYGTNETESKPFDAARFEEQFVEVVERVKTAAPGASILILGPPDRGVRERKDCDPPKKRKRKRGKKRRQPPPVVRGGTPPAGCEWKTPQVLLDIIAAERRVARRTDVAFFDPFTAMGGAGMMDRWVAQDPPLAFKDHTHLTSRGYDMEANLLVDAILAEYEAWRAKQSDDPPRSPR